MKRLIGISFVLCLLASPALAVCPATLQLKDNAGATPNAKYTDDGAGNCMANVAVQDGGSITMGSKGDGAATNTTSSWTLIALMKYLINIASAPGQLGDGTNAVGVAPGSTAPAAAKPGLVVAISPNTAEVGTPATGVTQPTGGVGLSGWLSGIYNKIIGTLTVSPGTLAGGATFVKGTTAPMTGTAATQLIAAVSGQRIYPTRYKCNNSSTTDTLVQLTDGSGGTVLDTLLAKGGAGEVSSGVTPLTWTTAGNGLYAQDTTTGASVICSASGYSG